MYHLGKIMLLFSPKDRNVISADASLQAAVKMWDDNMIIGNVEHELSDKVKVGDTVLVDYAPLPNSPAPKMAISKILRGEEAKKAIKFYEEYYTEKRKAQGHHQQAPFQPHQQIT